MKNGEQRTSCKFCWKKTRTKNIGSFLSLHLDVKDPDEVGPLWVVFNQTGDAAASLAPSGVAVRCEHLDHGGGQSL